MVIKKLILLLIVLLVLIFGYLYLVGDHGQEEGPGSSGGTSGGTQPPEELRKPGVTTTPEEMETPVETETFGEEETTTQETETAEEKGTAEEEGTAKEEVTPEGEVTPEETLTPGVEDETEEERTENITGEEEEAGNVQSAGTEPQTYLVRLKNYLFVPSELEVNTGDTVVWRNFEESGAFNLSSDEGLFEDQRLGYGNTLNYTFNETGSYNFSVNGYPNMQMTITVK